MTKKMLSQRYKVINREKIVTTFNKLSTYSIDNYINKILLNDAYNDVLDIFKPIKDDDLILLNKIYYLIKKDKFINEYIEKTNYPSSSFLKNKLNNIPADILYLELENYLLNILKKKYEYVCNTAIHLVTEQEYLNLLNDPTDKLTRFKVRGFEYFAKEYLQKNIYN